jgi:hypothetical protein
MIFIAISLESQGSPGTVIEAFVLKAFPECTTVPLQRSEAALEVVMLISYKI